MAKLFKFILPLCIIAAGFMLAKVMVASRPPLQPKPPEVILPTAKVAHVQHEPVQLTVASQGMVEAKRAVDLTSEVTGQVLWVSDYFNEGRFVSAGDVLLKIDPTDYEVAVAEAKVALSDANLVLAQEHAQYQQAAEDWASISQRPASDLTLRKPQMARAEAQVSAAEARLRQAQQDLTRTQIRAPFNGVVERKAADLGQFISAGFQVGAVFGTDVAEIRLPIPASEYDFLQLDTEQPAGVELTAQVGRRQLTWAGQLVRLENRLDAATRVFYAVVEVRDPYGLQQAMAEPMRVGTFVHASIEGSRLPRAMRISRLALHGDGVYVLDEQDRLRFRNIDVVRMEPYTVVVDGGLQDRDRLVLTHFEMMAEGMRIRPELTSPLSTVAATEEP